MADLFDLFNSPPAPPPPRRTPPPDSPPTPVAGPSRSLNPLFLSPGSATDSPRRPKAATQRRPRSPVYDRSNDFADPTDFDDDDSNRRPAPSAFDAPRVSAFDDLGPDGDADDVLDPFAGLKGADDDGEGAPKKRRVVAKVDGDRLTGDDGILKLMKAAKKFKVKGKGREADDLKDLLNVYQLWAHGMFPKGDFMGTMTRVEVVCRTRRMESAMKGYRDAFYPRPRTPTPPPRISRSRSRSQSRSRSPTTRQPSKSPSRAPSPDATASFQNEPSAPTAQPLFPARDDQDMEEDDGPDLDELLAMEEMEGGMAGSPVRAVPAASTAAAAASAQDVPDDPDDWDLYV